MAEKPVSRDRALMAAAYFGAYLFLEAICQMRDDILDALAEFEPSLASGDSKTSSSLQDLLSKDLTSSESNSYLDWERFGTVIGRPTRRLIDLLGITVDEFEEFLRRIPPSRYHRQGSRVPLFTFLLYLYLRKHGPMTLEELSKSIGVYPSHLRNSMMYLSVMGFVKEQDDGKYVALEVTE